jgi:hypothetical protein
MTVITLMVLAIQLGSFEIATLYFPFTVWLFVMWLTIELIHDIPGIANWVRDTVRQKEGGAHGKEEEGKAGAG